MTSHDLFNNGVQQTCDLHEGRVCVLSCAHARMTSYLLTSVRLQHLASSSFSKHVTSHTEETVYNLATVSELD